MNPVQAPRWLRASHFTADPEGHGGCRRTAQIEELFRRLGREPIEAPLLASAGRWQNFRKGWHWHKLLRDLGPRPEAIAYLGHRAHRWEMALAKHPSEIPMVWEDTLDPLPALAAKRTGHRVLAFPHNFETLVGLAGPDQFDPIATDSEIRRLRLADTVFVISREEQWLLETAGVRSHHLPYRPPAALASRFRAIRAARAARSSADGPWLLLGSAGNPPTFAGLKDLAAALRHHSGRKRRAIVAGYFSVEARKLFDKLDGVEFAGEIPPDEATRRLTECAGLIAWQRGGLGALTRIPEALAAGVPVLANANAARDTAGLAGVHTFASPDELLGRWDDPPPPMPPPPGDNESLENLIADALA